MVSFGGVDQVLSEAVHLKNVSRFRVTKPDGSPKEFSNNGVISCDQFTAAPCSKA